MRQQTRRQFLHAAGAAAGALIAHRSSRADTSQPRDTLSLGFSLYGMKGLDTKKAIRVVAEIGFDSVELCLMQDWDATPDRLGPSRRRDIRRLLAETGLKLTSLMEHVSLTGTAESQPVLGVVVPSWVRRGRGPPANRGGYRESGRRHR